MKIRKTIVLLTILAVIVVVGYFASPFFGSSDILETFQNITEPFYNPEITERTIPYLKASGSQVCLVNYKNATDPTWAELIAFLQRDDTDEYSYVEGSFVCADFAEMLHDNAEVFGIRAAWVGVDFVEGEDHALNAFNTTDKGLVYVDCTRGFSSPITSELGDDEEGRACEHDKIAYVVEGKEYGLISIDKATASEYGFYEEYKQKWKELEGDIGAYNSDVEVYNSDLKAYEGDVEAYEQVVGGREYISDHEEYARLNKLYNELIAKESEMESRGNELDARCEQLKERQEGLGYTHWASLDVITGVEVYW
jgi:hypothetical protein